MKIFEDTKFYVACPGNTHTGGPELLHQLASLLIQYGIDAYMFYTSQTAENPVDDAYLKYYVPYVLEVEDKPHNVLILYEMIGERYFEYKNVQKVFWWLSVDGYIKSTANAVADILSKPLEKSMPKCFYFQPEETSTEHWVQSEYARQFVMLNGIHEKNIYVVEDYLNQAFISQASNIDLSNKENVVAFNPSKGFHITRQLIEMAPDLKWCPIQGMTAEQVQFVLSKVKVYIDFGSHPGKDRIPREAAISGCVVITGKRGSAGNDIDINIPNEFKFGETSEDMSKVIDKIRDIFQNFEESHNKQKNYRERILNDKSRFETEVAEACNLKSANKINAVALCQGYGLKSYQLLKGLSENNLSIIPKFVIDDRLGNGQLLTGDFIERRGNLNYFVTNSAEKQPIDRGGVQCPVYLCRRCKIFISRRSHKKICIFNA